MPPRYAQTPAEELTVIQTVLPQWLKSHPEFARHSGTSELRAQLKQPKPAFPVDIEKLRATLLDEIQLLQLSTHEAGHCVALHHFVPPNTAQLKEVRFSSDLGKGGEIGVSVSGGASYVTENGWPVTDEDCKLDILFTRAGKFFEAGIPGIRLDRSDEGDLLVIKSLADRLGEPVEQLLNNADELLRDAQLAPIVESVAVLIYSKLKQRQYRVLATHITDQINRAKRKLSR